MTFPKIQSDLIIIPREKDGGFVYLVNDPQSEALYEFGEKEYFIICKLDGQTPLTNIQTDFETRFNIPLNSDYLEAFVRHLKSLGLLESETDAIGTSSYLDDQINIRKLFNPDRFLNFLDIICWWCFSPVFFIGFFMVMFLALGVLFKFGSDFILELQYEWENGFFILVPLLGLFGINVIIEIAKGVACKHYGGYVNTFGIWFLKKIIPRFYCDIRDYLWIRKRSDLIRILSAGIICQLLLWGVSIIGWKNTSLGTSIHTFWVLCTVASTIYLFLNAIPLFKRDGYMLLSIWLDIPDLRHRALTLFKSWFFRKPLPEPLTKQEIRKFKWYGFLVILFNGLFWGILLGVIGYFIVDLLEGIGAFIFLIILFILFYEDVKRLSMNMLNYRKILSNQHGIVSIRAKRVVQIGLPIVFILIMLIPYPFTVGGEFRFIPESQSGIRVQVAGEIKDVFGKSGDWVEKGQPVALLDGRDQKKRVEEVQAGIDEINARLRLLKEGSKPEEIAKAEQEVATFAKSLEYSILEAKRSEPMFENKAISEKDYKNVLKQKDLDEERLKLAQKNLELIKSGARDESIEALEAEARMLEVNLQHAKEDLKVTTIVSPADGIIITPYLPHSIGQYLIVGDLFAVVEDTKSIFAEIEIFEEDIGEVQVGAKTRIRTWAFPNKVFQGKVLSVAPVAYEKSKGRLDRALTEREWRIEQKEMLREKGKVIRVISDIQNANGVLKTDMTGYAKIECKSKLLGVAFTRWLVRFVFVEVWSWIP